MRGPVRTAGVVTLRLQVVHARGRRYVYTRIAGRARVRLPDLPFDHHDFLAAYVAASGEPIRRAPAGSIAAAIVETRASARMMALSAGYHVQMAAELDAIAEQAEDARLPDLRACDIRDDLRPLAPHAARKRLKAWRLLCTVAVEAGLLAEDPSALVRRPPAPQTDGHEPWSRSDIEAFRARWPAGTQARGLMELMHWTGARVSDAVRLGPGMIDGDGVLAFRQGKTGSRAYVPWTCQLPGYARGMEADRAAMHEALAALPRHLTFITTSRGSARSVKAAAGFLADAARTAGLERRTGHGLRKARAVALAEAGATTHQIGAWTGHQTLTEIQRYTRKADRRRAVIGTEQDRNTEKHSGPGEKHG